MKNFIKGFGLIVALLTSSAHAIPTLFFDGSIDYSLDSNTLAVSASLTDSADIYPMPTLVDSSMTFTAFLSSTESLSGGCFFCADSTKGNFVGSSDTLINDLEIIDGGGNTLLTAKFDGLSLEGINNGDKGEVIGFLSATGGSLMGVFESSELFALQLNLDTVFSNTMYDSGFAGRVDGNIQSHSVPEPSSLALLGLGIFLIGFVRKKDYIRGEE